MKGVTDYIYKIEPQVVDLTLKATVSAIGNYFLNTAGTDAQRKGFGEDVLVPQNRSWVLSRMTLEVDKRPDQYTDFTVTTWIGENNRLISTRNFTGKDDKGEVICRCSTQWCLIDFQKRLPISLSEVLPLCEEFVRNDVPAPCEAPRKVPSCTPATFFERKVVYSDIDFNSHMNTMRYIALVMDMLPLEKLIGSSPLRLDANFIRECRYGQTIKIGMEQRDNLYLFEITTDEGVVAFRASVEFKDLS